MPEDWRRAIIVPLYKGKGKREECNNYRGISLLSVPGKIYGRILSERMMKITDKSVGKERKKRKKSKRKRNCSKKEKKKRKRKWITGKESERTARKGRKGR